MLAVMSRGSVAASGGLLVDMEGWGGKERCGKDGAVPVRGFPDEKPFIPKAVPKNAFQKAVDAADPEKNPFGG
jgi:hypothetical protein